MIEEATNSVNGYFTDATSYITAVFNTINSEMVSSMEPIINTALVIAGLASVLYLAQILLPMIERNEGIEIYPLLRPIMVAVLVTQFGAFTSLLDMGLKGISDGVSASYVATGGPDINFSQAKERNKERMKAELKKEQEKKDDEGFSISGWFTDKFFNLIGFDPREIPMRFMLWLKYDLLFPLLGFLATLIGGLGYMCILLMSKFYLIFLGLIGPLSFALSQFNYFQSTFSDWLAKYIAVGLWPALANLLKYMHTYILAQMGSSFGDDFLPALIMFILLIFIAYFYFQIPEMGEYIVAGGGVGGLNRDMLGAAKATTGVAVGAATGVAAGMALKLMRGAPGNKFEQSLYRALSKQGEKTGAGGRSNRAGQVVGAKFGSMARKGLDYLNAKSKGFNTPEQRAEFISKKTQAHFDKVDDLNAPTKQELRTKAKRALSRQQRGHHLSADEVELVDRYKKGEYKGKGKYIAHEEPTDTNNGGKEQQKKKGDASGNSGTTSAGANQGKDRQQSVQVFQSYMKGFSEGVKSAGKSAPKSGANGIVITFTPKTPSSPTTPSKGWHPPMKRPD